MSFNSLEMFAFPNEKLQAVGSKGSKRQAQSAARPVNIPFCVEIFCHRQIRENVGPDSDDAEDEKHEHDQKMLETLADVN